MITAALAAIGIGLTGMVSGEDLPKIHHDDFESADAAKAWFPTDAKKWTIDEQAGNHVLHLHGKSDYNPPFRSPHSITLLKDKVVGDFVLTAKVMTLQKSTGHRDMVIFFGWQDPSHFYYVHLGERQDPNSSQIFIVNDAPRTAITEKNTGGIPWEDKHWHDVKVVRSVADGLIEIYFDDMEKPVKVAHDKTFQWGIIGLGSFDDLGLWDDVKINGVAVKGQKPVLPQPNRKGATQQKAPAKPAPKAKPQAQVQAALKITASADQGQDGNPPALDSGGYVVTEWATDPSIARSVAISLDDHGRAYLAVARRRKESSLDIRHHQDLVKTDLSFETVEDRRKYYREHLTGKSWLPDRNKDGVRDWNDLTVQKDSLVQVADIDGDGSAESIRVVGEFHTEVTGITAGVQAVGGDVFVTAEPDFLRYTDKDGDGFPETEEVVSTGYQVHMGQGGHNLSGVALGPDGRVYWSLGDKGHYVKTKEGKTYHAPNSGAIFRCEMDGSKVERYSTGERNAQELAFDAYGNLFSMDNDGDYPGEKERALYITEGSEHGWRLNWQWLRKQDFTKISGIAAYNPWMDEKLFLPDRENHAAYLTPTIGNFGPGPCGFTSNPGTALSEALSDCFFMTNNKNEVRIFKFQPSGAFFSFEEQPAIKGGLANTGLAFGPDGALYSASYGGDRGSIFRFDVAEGQRHPARAETQRILAMDSAKSAAEELGIWLDHADQRVRMKGQFELVRRGLAGGGLDVLQKALVGANTKLGKIHAIWGIGQLSRTEPAVLTFVLPAWHSGDPELIAQAAKVTGDIPGGVAFHEGLLAGLEHESPRVQFFCAIALGNRGYRKAIPALVELLATGGAVDPYLRHAAVMGLKGTMSPDQLAGLSSHESKAVRLGAIVALRKLHAPEVRAFLDDTDEFVLLEAARAIHDDQSIPDALADLSGVLEKSNFGNEALMRRVINAAFRNGSATDLQRLAQYLESGKGNSTLRRTALASILWWSQPPVLDPVEGRYRKHSPRDQKPVNKIVARLLPMILSEADLSEVLLNGVTLRGEAAWLDGVDGVDEYFGKWPANLQVCLLSAVAKVNHADLKSLVRRALASPHAEVREIARKHAAKAGVPAFDLLVAILNDPKPAGQGRAVLELAKLDSQQAREKLQALAKAYKDGKSSRDWKLELWQAAKMNGIELPETPDRLEYGGDPERGKKLVMEHAAAQCIRCHKVGKVGSDLGPDLTKIGASRDRPKLVASMLEPNREIVEGYGTVQLKMKNGEEIAGVLSKKEKSNWIITMADGKPRKVAATEIVSHTLVSLMPPVGLLMKPEEIRDVISYLAELK